MWSMFVKVEWLGVHVRRVHFSRSPVHADVFAFDMVADLEVASFNVAVLVCDLVY